MSDERSKQRIKELENLNETYAALLDTPPATSNVKPRPIDTDAIDEARANARAHEGAGSYTYAYRNPDLPGAAPGRHAGPMAQQLERIPGVVTETPYGKQVDTGRLSLATASATGDQERRLRALEDDYATLNDQGGMTPEEARISRELAAGEQRALANIRRAGSR
jgi:hypothetical protein